MPEAPWGPMHTWLTCITVVPAQFGATRIEKTRVKQVRDGRDRESAAPPTGPTSAAQTAGHRRIQPSGGHPAVYRVGRRGSPSGDPVVLRQRSQRSDSHGGAAAALRGAVARCGRPRAGCTTTIDSRLKFEPHGYSSGRSSRPTGSRGRFVWPGQLRYNGFWRYWNA